jgi:molybdopterin converting factor small subunit
MRVTLVYHAFLKDTAGLPTETLEVFTGASVLDAVREAARRHPAAGPLLLLRSGEVAPYVKVQHNGRPLAGPAANIELNEGDSLTLYPALTGG